MPRRPSPVSRTRWPRSGAYRGLLEYLDDVREAEGRKSLSQVGKRARIATSRVSEILTGQSLPVDDRQVENLVRGLGGGDDEVAEAIRRYRRLADEDLRW